MPAAATAGKNAADQGARGQSTKRLMAGAAPSAGPMTTGRGIAGSFGARPRKPSAASWMNSAAS